MKLLDKTTILEQMPSRSIRLEKIDESLREDVEIISALMKAWPDQFRELSPNMKSIKQVVINACSFGQNLEFFPRQYKKDSDIVKLCLDCNGNNLKYADITLRNNKSVALYAINKNPYSYNYVAKNLKSDDDIVKTTLKKQGMEISLMPQKIIENKSYFLLAMKSNAAAYQYAPRQFREDPDILDIACECNGNLPILPERIKDDKDIILKLLKCPEQYKCPANDRVYADGFQYISERLKRDRDVLKLILLQDPSKIEELSHYVKHDVELLLDIAKVFSEQNEFGYARTILSVRFDIPTNVDAYTFVKSLVLSEKLQNSLGNKTKHKKHKV